LKILFAAAIALPMSGPKALADPMCEAPNIIAKRAMKTSVGFTPNTGWPYSSIVMLFSIILPADQNIAAKTIYCVHCDRPNANPCPIVYLSVLL